MSHDIGGFMLPQSQVRKNKAGVEIIDPERYVRWLQFGVFGPILRFHSAPGCGSRRPYDYDEELAGACRRWLRVRHSLLPYIYTAARTHHETGIPIVRGLYLEGPQSEAAYRFDEYFFGPALLVAPVLSASRERSLCLPAGDWWEFETGDGTLGGQRSAVAEAMADKSARRTVGRALRRPAQTATRAAMLTGGCELTRDVALDDVPVYVKAGSIITRQDPDGDIHAGHVERLWLDVYPGANGAAWLYEDDGRSTRYRQGEFCRTLFKLRQTDEDLVLSGRVTEGRPVGAARRISVTIALPRAPQSVACGRAELAAVACGPGRCRIELPELPAARAWKLRIRIA